MITSAVVAVLLLAAQGTPPATANTPTPGKIVLYRGSGAMGMGLACPVRYKGQELVELGRGRYAEFEVPAGRYILNNKTSSVEVSVAAGETSYVRCVIKAGLLTGRADLQIVDRESFTEHQADYERKEATSSLAPGSLR